MFNTKEIKQLKKDNRLLLAKIEALEAVDYEQKFYDLEYENRKLKILADDNEAYYKYEDLHEANEKLTEDFNKLEEKFDDLHRNFDKKVEEKAKYVANEKLVEKYSKINDALVHSIQLKSLHGGC